MNCVGSFSLFGHVSSVPCQLQAFLELTFWYLYSHALTLTSTMEGKTRMLILKAVFSKCKTGFSPLPAVLTQCSQRSHDHLATEVWLGVCLTSHENVISGWFLCYFVSLLPTLKLWIRPKSYWLCYFIAEMRLFIVMVVEHDAKNLLILKALNEIHRQIW